MSMLKIKSERKKMRLAPSLVAIGVFIIGMAFLFFNENTSLNKAMFIVCGIYSLICLLFLVFQLYAFVQVHINYDEDVERVKYQVFEAEGVDYIEQEIL